jgi:DNA repair ATPase RecN
MEDDNLKKFNEMCDKNGFGKANMKEVWKKFDKMCEKFDLSEESLKKAWETIDKLAYNAADQGEKMKYLEEKMSKLDLIDGIVQSQDEVLKILYRMQAEQAANKSRSDRHEERIENLEHDVKKIKVAIA